MRLHRLHFNRRQSAQGDDLIPCLFFYKRPASRLRPSASVDPGDCRLILRIVETGNCSRGSSLQYVHHSELFHLETTCINLDLPRYSVSKLSSELKERQGRSSTSNRAAAASALLVTGPLLSAPRPRPPPSPAPYPPPPPKDDVIDHDERFYRRAAPPFST